MKQFQITSRPRHLRYVYFIDIKYPYEKLFKLICENQKIWGGRYNPIIPVKEQVISENYISLIKFYDPDYVFYSENIDPEIIKRLGFFNPCGYYNLDEQPRKENILGVDSFYFLSKFDTNSKIILPHGLWETKSPLLNFYKLNFGIESDTFVSENELSKAYQRIDLDKQSFNSLNQILHQEKPIIKSGLSRMNLNTKILRDLKHAQHSEFEIVIDKDKSSNNNLIYYWNRLLFEGRNIIYLTIEELELLSNDKYFGGILYDLSNDQAIKVVSHNLSKDEIQKIITEKLNPISFYRSFQFKDIENFPYETLDANGLFERNYGEVFLTQTLITEKGLFHLPKLSFTNEVGFHPQKWAIDIELKKFEENNYQNEIKFPFTTETWQIIKNVEGRINRKREISIIVHNQKNTSDNLEIAIPEFGDLLRQLISHPKIHGQTVNTKYIDISHHDASNKLSAFLKTFNFNFWTIDDFFTDKFWVDLFEGLIKSERVAGDSIHFEEIKSKAIQALQQKGISLGNKGETLLNEENLELGLKETIGELCDYRVFLKGFKIKCPKCSSEFWYPIREISEAINCKGCLESFKLPIEPKFAYKLNDLIKNNIFQSKTSRDGNLTVIRTLASIQSNSRLSFEYSPQINLYSSLKSRKPCSEIDIVCLSDGKLIIGEAKHKSTGFFEKNSKGENSLDTLVELAQIIKPDTIILSCYEDIHTKLEKAKKYIDGKFYRFDYVPEIETLNLRQPDDFNIGGARYFYY
ncbi:hypothetical protein [Carboxylicivirga taeanensis]|uniref:hypothetical protein n=1 Tax=Carboxylicivirga taeanensis TaxID=1416875 RepID=UPI003F6DFAF9